MKKHNKLDVGCGQNLTPGWDRLDIDSDCEDLTYCCSMTEMDSVKAGLYKEIRIVHSLEYVSWWEIPDVLSECFRILKVDGRIEIVTSNFKCICESYLKGDLADYKKMNEAEQERIKINGIPSPTLCANFKIFSSTVGMDIHYSMLDWDLLNKSLAKAGFIDIELVENELTLVVRAKKPGDEDMKGQKKSEERKKKYNSLNGLNQEVIQPKKSFSIFNWFRGKFQ